MRTLLLSGSLNSRLSAASTAKKSGAIHVKGARAFADAELHGLFPLRVVSFGRIFERRNL